MHKWNAPTDPLDLISFTGCFSVLSDTVFGVDQAGSKALRAHAAFIRTNAAMLRTAVPTAELPGVLLNIMRSLQLSTAEYLNVAQELGSDAAPPDYSFIENALKRRTWFQLSAMPPRYLTAVQSSAPHLPSTQPIISAATGPPATIPPPGPVRTAGTAVEAPATHQVTQWHAKFTASALSIVALKAMANRPALCLSYHLRGKCFDNCRDKGTHRSLGTAEHQIMQGFVDTAL